MTPQSLPIGRKITAAYPALTLYQLNEILERMSSRSDNNIIYHTYTILYNSEIEQSRQSSNSLSLPFTLFHGSGVKSLSYFVPNGTANEKYNVPFSH